jgi:DNA-binding NarL/FixJ family response regulator
MREAVRTVNSHPAPLCTGLPKTCCRCGRRFQDFSDRGLARVCPECKKPKVRSPRYSPTLRGRPLTAREKQVVDLVANGRPSKEIAHQLRLGEGTIKVAISTILAKTGLENRTCLAVWWIQTGRNSTASY